MLLGKKEKVLMNIVYKQASRSSNGQCLVTPLDLLSKIPYRVDFKEQDLEETLNQLVLDRYFECDTAKTPSGDVMYCITLRENGISYMRDKRVSRRKLVVRIIITIAFAALGFSLRSILKAIFGS